MIMGHQKNKNSVIFGPNVTFIFKDADACKECRNGVIWMRYAAVGYECLNVGFLTLEKSLINIWKQSTEELCMKVG
jgi:hypothetical protein